MLFSGTSCQAGITTIVVGSLLANIIVDTIVREPYMELYLPTNSRITIIVLTLRICDISPKLALFRSSVQSSVKHTAGKEARNGCVWLSESCQSVS